jgi:plastocyanin
MFEESPMRRILLSRRRPGTALILSLLAVGLADLAGLTMGPAAGATTYMVHTGPGTTFNPQVTTLQIGDSVTFVNGATGGFHDVHADDNSFRCANGCDDTGGNGNPASPPWTFTRTFNTAGTIGYHCEIHGRPGGGMFGTLVVNAPVSAVPTLGSAGLTLLAALLAASCLVLRQRDRLGAWARKAARRGRG